MTKILIKQFRAHPYLLWGLFSSADRSSAAVGKPLTTIFNFFLAGTTRWLPPNDDC
jgi:hypothetical protein